MSVPGSPSIPGPGQGLNYDYVPIDPAAMLSSSLKIPLSVLDTLQGTGGSTDAWCVISEFILSSLCSEQYRQEPTIEADENHVTPGDHNVADDESICLYGMSPHDSFTLAKEPSH